MHPRAAPPIAHVAGRARTGAQRRTLLDLVRRLDLRIIPRIIREYAPERPSGIDVLVVCAARDGARLRGDGWMEARERTGLTLVIFPDGDVRTILLGAGTSENDEK